MNRWTELYAPLIGRILMGGFFLWNGIEEILNFTATINAFSSLPYPLILATIATGIEVLGGIALVVGLQSRISAMLLIFYVLLSSTFVLTTATTVDIQLFLENMAVVGGLLYITAYGSGKWSKN